jgi:hypothetical protein
VGSIPDEVPIIKRPGRERDDSDTSGAEIKNT